MANRFWNFVTVLVGGTLARASDVNSSLSGIQTGFDNLEAEIDAALTVSTAPGDMTIGENAAARANKLIAFDINGDIVLSTTIGTYRGNHANAAGTAYYVRDVVKDAAASLGLNNLYICQTAHTSTGGLLADTANWALLVDVASVVASQVAAAASAAAAATSYDNFDDRYLGSFTTAASPTLDNDGNAIITGALFFDTTLNRMKVRTTGATWALTTANAVDVAITDAGGRITATEVEGALQEITADNWVTTARIVDNAVTNAELADMDTQRIKGRTTAGTGDPEDLTAAQASAIIKDVTETLTNKTLTSPVLNGTLSGTAFLDEDAMTSNSAIAVPSQQSVKAYVDALSVSGTWSPTFYGGTVSGAGFTISGSTHYYTKIGNILILNGQVTVTAVGTASGQFRMGNLPYNFNDSIIVGACDFQNINLGAGLTQLITRSISSYLAFNQGGDSVSSASTQISDLQAGGNSTITYTIIGRSA